MAIQQDQVGWDNDPGFPDVLASEYVVTPLRCVRTVGKFDAQS